MTTKMSDLKCKIGLIADIQYADVENGHNFARTIERYYREALNHLKEAVDAWNQEEPKLECVLQLGDIIDGKSKRVKKSQQDLEAVLNEFHRLNCPTYHILGNHELYNFSRQWLLESELNSTKMDACTTPKPGQTAYYHMSPAPGLRIVCLDPYDISMLGHKRDAPEYKEAETRIRKVNHNKDLNAPDGMSTENRR